MRILGIDQSLTGTGLAIVTGGDFELLEVVKPRTKGYERVAHIVDRCVELAEQCDLVAVERPALSVKNSASTGALFGLFGVLTQALWACGKEPIVINSMHRAGYATGKMAARKDAVIMAAARRYRDERLSENNILDAALLAAMVARIVGEPVAEEGTLPAANLAVLTKVALPRSVEGLVSGALASERAWLEVAARVTQPQLAALRALEGSSPEYARALVEFAAEHGYEVFQNQKWVTCTRRLEQFSHACGAKKCSTEWATPSDWERPVLLRKTQGDGWAILSQDRSGGGTVAPVGDGRYARLHTGSGLLADVLG